MSDQLTVRYVPLSQVALWERNPKLHHLGDLAASIERYGFKEIPKYEPALNDGQGGIVAGNGRIETLAALHQQGRPAPRGIVEQDGEWCVPIAFGVDAASQEEAEAYGIDSNNLSLSGGDFTAWDMARLWSPEYTDILASLATADALPITVDGDALDGLLAGMADSILDSASPDGPRASLADRFGVPPFSVLDARQGYWQERKRAWIALGIQSELGRGDTAVNTPHDGKGFADGLVDLRARPSAERARMANDGMADSPDSLRIDDNRQSARHAAPGGSLRDAATLGPDGKTRRGDGRGRAAATVRGGPATMDAQRKAWREGQGVARSYAVNEWVRDTLPDQTGLSAGQSGTSIFDPVLCELAYRWFCPPGGAILDPFAGGSVRGIIAAKLGYAYTGIDLRPEQIAANEEQAKEIAPDAPPRWIVGDSRDIAMLAPGAYDLIFSCPPYADLEIYSDDPRDLSTFDYADFLSAYRAIIAASVALLQPDRFAVFVVGDVRDKKGFYRNFVGATVDAFQDAGMTLYNEAILVTQAGSLPIRIAKQFEGYRKLGKTHQNVLCFYKGDPKRIKDFGAVEMGDPAEQFGEVVA